MTLLANVALTDTFDTWRTRTNQIIVSLDQNDAKTEAAIVHANVGFDQANTARDHANTAHASANAGLLQANTARDHANAAHASANSGLLQANTARDHANAAFLAANTVDTLGSGYVFPHANQAFLQANTARIHANTAHASANAGLLQANTARDHANAGYAHANSANVLAQNLVFPHANQAFDQANTGRGHANVSFSVANLSFGHANVSFSVANLSFGHANLSFGAVNAAFAKANTAIQNTTTTLAGTLTVTGEFVDSQGVDVRRLLRQRKTGNYAAVSSDAGTLIYTNRDVYIDTTTGFDLGETLLVINFGTVTRYLRQNTGVVLQKSYPLTGNGDVTLYSNAVASLVCVGTNIYQVLSVV